MSIGQRNYMTLSEKVFEWRSKSFKKLVALFAIGIARLHWWLGKQTIPQDTIYCYKRYYSNAKYGKNQLSRYTWTVSCPYHTQRSYNYSECLSNAPKEEYYIEWCEYLDCKLDIQDACKDCGISEGLDY